MYLLPAKALPSRKALAIFTGARRIMKPGEILYMPQWCASTLLERAPEVEAIEEEHPALALLRDVKREMSLEYQVTSAVLAVCRGLPIDSTLLKGLPINV